MEKGKQSANLFYIRSYFHFYIVITKVIIC